jgi:hypothetical protein
MAEPQQAGSTQTSDEARTVPAALPNRRSLDEARNRLAGVKSRLSSLDNKVPRLVGPDARTSRRKGRRR